MRRAQSVDARCAFSSGSALFARPGVLVEPSDGSMSRTPEQQSDLLQNKAIEIHGFSFASRMSRPAGGRWPGTTEERFWARVDRGDGCWEWRGCKKRNGYGWVGVRKEQWVAHRLAWTFVNGPIPTGLHVCHRCDNPSCVRPDHLFIGSHADNMADMKAKGRGRASGRPRGLYGAYRCGSCGGLGHNRRSCSVRHERAA